MPKNKKIECFIQKALDQFGSDEDILKLLDPCTKLTVTLNIVRGQTGVRREVEYCIKRQLGVHLADETPLTEKEWETIFSLPAFSKRPERRGDAKMRELLLQFKAKGPVSNHDVPANTTNRINEVLEASKLPYRVTSCKPEGQWYHFRLTRII